MTADVTVRPATRADLPALGALGARLVELHYGFDRLRFLAPMDGLEGGYASFLGSRMTAGDAVVLVAVLDGRVVGYLYGAVEPVSWEELRDEAGYVHDIIVDEVAQGRGAASLLVEAAVTWFRERGMPRVLLWTAQPNEAAQHLFAKLGFRRTMIEMTREIE